MVLLITVICGIPFSYCALAQSSDSKNQGEIVEQDAEAESLPEDEPSRVDSGDWDHWSDLNDENTVVNASQSQLTAVAVTDTSGLDQAMEQSLRETMIEQAKSYYPMIRSMSLEASEEFVMLEIAYLASSEKDLISLSYDLNKEQMTAQVQILSPLLQKSEDMSMDGDLQFLKKIKLVANPGLTASLGSEAQISFVQKIDFKLMKPVQMSVKQLPGLIRIEFRRYLAEDDKPQDEAEDESSTLSDITFNASAIPKTTTQVFGQSFQTQRDYENEVNFGGEPTLLEQLEQRQPRGIVTASPYTNFSRGASWDSVMEDARIRSPRFGGIEYWKEHLSGALTNTTRLLKQRRGQHGILVEEPALALSYERKGAANIKLGYNYQKQYPFFNQKLGRLAPADGVLRNDFQGGITYVTQSPWVFSLQNRLGIFTSENTSSSSKFGDRINQYRYEAGNAIRYRLKRGFVQAGAGMKFETQEVAIRNRDIESYLSLLWYRPISKKLATRMEYNYTHRFFEEGQLESDKNVHKTRFGVEYKLTKNSLLKPSLGLAFYDGEAIAGLIGDIQYKHFISGRDTVTLSYNSDFVRNRVSSFGSGTLNNRRVTSNFSDGNLIRYHAISARYQHKLSKRTTAQVVLSYRRELALEVEPRDKFSEYRLSVNLKRQISKKWVAALGYALSYLDAYTVSTNALGGITKTDQGNTNHQLTLRMYRYFGN